MSKRLIHLFIGLCLTLFSFASRAQVSPEQFVPIAGSNLTEKKVQWLWQTLPIVIKACRVLSECQMTAPEKQILDQMIPNLPRYNPQSLQFKSEKENPGLFTSDQNEAHRVAVTGSDPQSLITLNSDRIGSLSLVQIISLLGHETVHHVGIKDDEDRIPDQIGAKLGRYFETNSVQSSLEEYDHPEIQILYFGIGVPKDAEYFQLFPHRQTVQVAFWDSESVYQLTTFDPSHSSDCYKYENHVVINQQVSSPTIRVNRWFAGDSMVGVNFNVRIQNVCWNQSEHMNPTLKGVNMIGQLSLQFRLRDPKVQNWSQSPLEIYAKSMRAVHRPPAAEEGLETITLAKVDSVTTAPATAKAGQTWKSEILVSYNGDQAPTACAATMSGQTWHSVDFFGLPVPFVLSRCILQKVANGKYKVQMEMDFPTSTVPGVYDLSRVGLYVGSDASLIGVQMQAPIVIKVESAAAPVKILSHRFLGLEKSNDPSVQGILQLGRTYDFEVQIENADSVYDGMISGQIEFPETFYYNFVGNFVSQDHMFKGAQYKKRGNILIATFQVQVMESWGPLRSQKLIFQTLQFVTGNLGEVLLDFRENPEVYLLQ